MAYSVTIGRCVTLNSPLHRIDARLKVVFLLLFSISSFFITGLPSACFMGILAGSLSIIARIPFGVLGRTLRPFVVLLVFSVVLNALVMQGGTTLIEGGFFTVTSYGLYLGSIIAYRTLIALIFGVLLVATTTPLALCEAFESLLSPLRVFGLPYQDIAMIFSIALRYIPLLSEEATLLLNAQKSRAASPKKTSPLRHVRMYAPLIIPLLLSSIRHAERLAIALEARCWAATGVRTRLHLSRYRKSDGVFAFCMASALIFFYFLGY